VNPKAVVQHKLFIPALAAALTGLCGLALLGLPLRERWVNASYDYLFRFGARAVTNKVAVVLMDNAACYNLGQTRSNWNRALHAELLRKLTRDHCPVVVFDVLFRAERDAATDHALAEAMRRHGHVVLMAKVTDPKAPTVEAAQVVLPNKLFLDAATNVGIGQAEIGIARRHWPFPAAEERDFPSLPWVAARLVRGPLNEKPAEQWLRFYGEKGAWDTFSYHVALSNAPGAFRGKIVFIGSSPQQKEPDIVEEDKFRTPYTFRTKTAVGGVEIMVTTFLNLVNDDWLRRAPLWVEAMVLAGTGILLGGGLFGVRPLAACGLALVAILTVAFAAVWLSFFTNYWFPWLIIVGGQVPCALTCSVVASRFQEEPKLLSTTLQVDAIAQASPPADVPEAPDYELFDPPFGEGAYGKVWLARNAIGQWQALKAVYQARFGPYREPYEREFNGIKRYKPVSDKHPGLLRVDFVSTRKEAGYFYYVMELGDALEPGWEKNPRAYKPRDLASMRAQAPGARLPVRECVRIGVVLAEALEFLHQQGLTHRDIKPQNIIFVNDRPKLADVGLTAELPLPGRENTSVGTPGYMPPAPEPPGTIQADIYGLGMVLYVIRTGRDPDHFPEVSSTLIEGSEHSDFIRLNSVILKACQPDRAQRFASAAQMGAALWEIEKGLRQGMHS
jgi:CHASE2 domain-containing sensor protein